MPQARLHAPFDHPDCIFEPKLDGFRALAYIERDATRLKTAAVLLYMVSDGMALIHATPSSLLASVPCPVECVYFVRDSSVGDGNAQIAQLPDGFSVLLKQSAALDAHSRLGHINPDPSIALSRVLGGTRARDLSVPARHRTEPPTASASYAFRRR
jgi:hypothetical protein